MAHREVSRKVTDDDALVKPKVPATKPNEISKRMTALDSSRLVAAVSASKNARVTAAKLTNVGVLHNEASTSRLLLTIPTGIPLTSLPDAQVMLKSEAIADLSATSRKVLADSKIDLTRLEPFTAVNLIEDEMRMTAALLTSTESATIVMSFGGVMFETGALRDSLFSPVFGPAAPVADRCNFQAGVGDLLMVRQTLKAYELAEFAHVENVLAGEYARARAPPPERARGDCHDRGGARDREGARPAEHRAQRDAGGGGENRQDAVRARSRACR